MIRCGSDIIEIKRIKDGIENIGEHFIKRIYTDNEIEYCENKKAQKYQSYAGRFAAKEAIFKALSEIIENKFSIKWTDLEIVNEKSGKPKVRINSKNININRIQDIDISISHCKEYATAVCVVSIS